MAEYILVRDGGCEGHSEPLAVISNVDLRLVLNVLAHTYDSNLCVYRVPDADDSEGAPQRLSLKDL